MGGGNETDTETETKRERVRDSENKRVFQKKNRVFNNVMLVMCVGTSKCLH